MIKEINAITFFTRDMAAACRFYSSLGFECSRGGPEKSFTTMEAGTVVINLIHKPEYTGHFFGRLILRVDSADEEHAAVVNHGLQPLFEPRIAHWGEKYFHILDPDGHEISFAEDLD